MAKICIVVHRFGVDPFDPTKNFEGGSEHNCFWLATEMVRLGHEVWVFSTTCYPNTIQNGIKVTNDPSVIHYPWDLVFIHGSCPAQNIVHSQQLSVPVYYLLVEPPKNAVAKHLGTQHATYIGCGTTQDWNFCEQINAWHKAVPFTYGIPKETHGNPGFRDKYDIKTEKMYLSCGGWWPHKRHNELKQIFLEANVPDCTLVLMGYSKQFMTPPTECKNVKVITEAPCQDVFDGMYEADLLIQNSESEGFGLSLLQAMYLECPWISTDIAAAYDLSRKGLGTVYHNDEELKRLLISPSVQNLIHQRQYVEQNHLVENSVKNLLGVLK